METHQNFSEFELHARAVLGIPVEEITLEKNGASAVVLANQTNENTPTYSGINKAAYTQTVISESSENHQHVHSEEWQLLLLLEMNQLIHCKEG